MQDFGFSCKMRQFFRLANMTSNKFTLELVEKYRLAPGVFHFIFKSPAVLNYKAGQFLSLHLTKDGKEYRRNYSIANFPGTDLVEIAVSYVPGGLATTVLDNLEPGAKVSASGPYGIFVLPEKEHPQHYMLIGTGTGITPYRAMLPIILQLLENGVHFSIIAGARTRAEVLYSEDFLRINHPNYAYYTALSREDSTFADYEYLGYVQDKALELGINATTHVPYLCGNPNMVDVAYGLFIAEGLNKRAVKREKYVTSR